GEDRRGSLTDHDSGTLAAPPRSRQRCPLPRRGDAPRPGPRRPPGASPARLPRVLVELARTASGSRRGGPPGRGDGPAWVRRLGQAASRLRPRHTRARRRRSGQGARRPRCGDRRKRMGRVRRLGGRLPAPTRGQRALLGVCATPSRHARGAASRKTPRRASPHTRDAGPHAPGTSAVRPLQRLPPRAPAVLEQSGLVLSRRGGRVDVPAGDEPVAGSALRVGVPPLAGSLPSAGRRAQLQQGGRRADAATHSHAARRPRPGPPRGQHRSVRGPRERALPPGTGRERRPLPTGGAAGGGQPTPAGVAGRGRSRAAPAGL
ncbi:MAG: Epoxide hydrolase, partial [uncultured Nocardioidaceae bacterium]